MPFSLNQRRFLKALRTWLAKDEPGRRVNEWVQAGGIKAYVRLTNRYLNDRTCSTVEVATIEVPARLQGRGTLKAVWAICMNHAAREVCYAECVNNPQLLPYYLNPGMGGPQIR